jgi:hypothetical protein
LDRERLASAIENYWVEAGAKVGGRKWRRLEPLSLEQTHELGFAVSKETNRWVTVCDSERYTADFRLAQHLAERLGVRVRFDGQWDASDEEVERYLGGRGKRCEHEPSDYYDQLGPKETAQADWIFLSVEGVNPETYDTGPEHLVNGEPPIKPVVGELGHASKSKDAYLVVESGASLNTAEPSGAHGSLASALGALAESGERGELRVLMGEKWYSNPDTWDAETGEPIALTDDSVSVVGAEITDSFLRSDVFEAWLMSLLLVSSDVGRAEQTVLNAKIEGFLGLISDWDGLRAALADRTLVEARRLREIPEATEGIESLFQKAADGDVDACKVLEKIAFRKRNLMAWRYARALNEGKQAVAKMYKSRVSF